MASNTVIGSNITIDGEVRGEESLVVQGTVKGRIVVSDKLTVDQGANVEADVESQTISIAGKLTGNIAAREKVEVKADARVVGDIRSPRIAIADGASFKGNIDMDV
jgi:cytoskeletal protein CcmA (bactofilin family)